MGPPAWREDPDSRTWKRVPLGPHSAYLSGFSCSCHHATPTEATVQPPCSMPESLEAPTLPSLGLDTARPSAFHVPLVGQQVPAHWEAFPDTLAHQARSPAPGGAFMLAEKCYLLTSPSTVPITMPQASGPAVPVPLGEYQSCGNEVLFREPLWGARRMGQGESVPFPLGWAAGRTRARASETWLLPPALQEPLGIPTPHGNLPRSEPRTLHL